MITICMLYTILTVLILFLAVTATFVARLSRTTLWAGRVLADSGVLSQMSRGLQDAITPPALTAFKVASFAVRIAIVIVGTFYIAWYAGILALGVSIVLTKIAGKLTPSYLAFYLQVLLQDMHRRNANYTRDRDPQRTLASQSMIDGLSELLVSASGLPVPVPTTLEAMRATKERMF